MLKEQVVCYIQTVRSFSRALVLEVPWQRCLEANKLGKPLYSICTLGRTLVRSVIIPSSLGPWNYSRSQSEWKKLVSGENGAGRRITTSQHLLPAKQIEGGEREAGGGDRQLNASAITWAAKLRKRQKESAESARGTFWRAVLAVVRGERLITNTFPLTWKSICGATYFISSFWSTDDQNMKVLTTWKY